MKTIFATWFLLLIAGSAHAVVQPLANRSDLEMKLGALICANKNLDNPMIAWRAGIYDAQISGQRILKKSAAGKLTPQDLQATAQALAEQNNHNAISYGMCSDGSGWVASLPAPKALIVKSTKSLTIPVAELKQQCQKVRVDFAAANGGAARSIRVPEVEKMQRDVHVNAGLLEDGTLSVSCLPKSPSWQGNTLWSLIPINKGPKIAPPQSGRLSDKKLSSQARLAQWINAVRKKNGVKTVSTTSAAAASMTAIAKKLSQSQSITHNRQQLDQFSADLKKSGVRLIGENRVMANSLEEMAWMLWNSPMHRELLIDPKAKSLAISLEKQDQRYFAVIVLAQ